MADEQTPMDRLFRLIENVRNDPKGRTLHVTAHLHNALPDDVPDGAMRDAREGTKWHEWNDGPVRYVAFIKYNPHLTDEQWRAQDGGS